MSVRFFERPIINSPYAPPRLHHALDADGQPIDQPPVEGRRRSELITPVPKSKRQKAKPAAQTNNDKNPEVGWSKEQVVALYGKTDNMRVGSEGETWIYNLNMGEQFIPFNIGYRPKLRIIVFGPDGKVKSWSYSK